MKKLNIVAGCLVSLLCCSSCDKFLELTPQDTKIVTTVEDYRDIMATYLYFLKTPGSSQVTVFGTPYAYPYFDLSRVLGIYTGEANLNTAGRFYDKSINDYTKEGKNLLNWMNTDPYVWNRYYSFLGPINQILIGIESAETKDEQLRNYIKGEALVWRAYAYFKLLQYFSPYKNNQYGVPVYLDPVTDIGVAMPERNTQKEVFDQILKDCNRALELLEVTPTNVWNLAYRKDFIHAMLASIYTWKAMSGAAEETDWGNAARCATVAMGGRVLSNSSDQIRKIFDGKDVLTQPTLKSDEMYFRLAEGGNSGYLFNYVTAYYGTSLTDGLTNAYYYMYADQDIRKKAYFTSDGKKTDKYNLLGNTDFMGVMGGGGCLMPFRLAEMYLIKAEALVRQGKPGEARPVLEEFMNARYTDGGNIPSGAEDMLNLILLERNREFFMENDYRWLDMKRLGIRMERVIGGEKFVLEPDDFRYSFPIPQKELELNRNMVQTPGWENIIL